MIKNRSSIFQYFFYAFIVLMILLLFFRFTVQNDRRIREQNRIYAEDAARQTAMRIDDTLANSLALIKQYAQFLSFSLKEPVVTPETIREVERNSPFNTVRFSDSQGVNYSGDGAVNNVADREFFKEGMKGNSGISVVFDSRLYGQPVLGFYAPVHFRGKIIGVLRGTYLADNYLREMLEASYFGKVPQIFLCSMDGEIIANSSPVNFSGNVVNVLTQQGLLTSFKAASLQDTFKPSSGNLVVNSIEGESDNLCVAHLPAFNFLLVQAFPSGVTSAMVKNANIAGIELELSLLLLGASIAAYLLIMGRIQKRALLRENRFFSAVVKGMSSVFEPLYGIADLRNNDFTKIRSEKIHQPDESESDDYAKLLEEEAALIINEEERLEFNNFFQPEALRHTLADNDYTIFLCHQQRDGEDHWENIIVACLDRVDGLPCHVLFLRQDITDMKKRELRTSERLSIMNRKERQYRLALTSNALCNYEFNVSKDRLEEDIVEIQDGKAVSMLRPKGLAIPCPISSCFTAWAMDLLPESREAYKEHTSLDFLLQCFEDGKKEVDLDYWRVDRSGEERCIRQAFYLTRDIRSGDIMAMTVLRDITAQVISHRKQTQALKDALSQARQASAAKTTFLSNMSHDIRTPMNAIIGFATIAANHLDNREQVNDCLQKVLSSSTHLLSLINDILDMSRIESGKLHLKIQECNISEIMHGLLSIIQSQIKAKQLHLFIDTFEIENEHVMADPLKLNQVFINLLGNAVKYTPAGGTINFGIRQKESSREGWADYVFIVKDNGIGMSKNFVTHIFEPFERESTTTRSGIQGTGLGMAITKNIIELMDGAIEVESAPGIGSTFTVNLSFALPEKEERPLDLAAISALKVLVVDDDKHVCDTAMKMLHKLGLASDCAASGKEALEKTRKAIADGQPFTTFIIDWQMPEMGGVETSENLRELAGGDISIIILTAYEWVDIEEEAKAAGVRAFCPKPLFMSDLINALLATQTEAENTEEEKPSEQALFAGKRVLLVDDLEMNREMAEFILTESGFLVETAPDGTDAVEMVRTSPEKYYDIILMDVQMPTMNGYEATRAIRNLERVDVENMPIIAMTANALEDDKEAALKSGMNSHISKPIDIEKFFEVLHKFVDLDNK